MSKAFEKLIDKYAERKEFDRLAGYHADRLAMLRSIEDGSYDKMPPGPEVQPLKDEIAREIAYLEKTLADKT